MEALSEILRDLKCLNQKHRELILEKEEEIYDKKYEIAKKIKKILIEDFGISSSRIYVKTEDDMITFSTRQSAYSLSKITLDLARNYDEFLIAIRRKLEEEISQQHSLNKEYCEIEEQLSSAMQELEGLEEKLEILGENREM
jgi:hypothetical protein